MAVFVADSVDDVEEVEEEEGDERKDGEVEEEVLRHFSGLTD